MIGIYKITNNLSGKIYIGQSNNIERRWKEHCAPNRWKTSENYIDVAIHKYGKENFSLEVLEECSIAQLNEREQYWIAYYNTYKGNGYNATSGGQDSIGEGNGRAKMTEEDVIYIRKAYAAHKRRRDVYKQFEHKIAFGHFARIWDGTSWSHIMPEVYTSENKDYYCHHVTDGEQSSSAIFTDDEVIGLRERYVNETAREIWKDYKDRVAYRTLQQILWGASYSNLPIYKKKEKKWINI